MEKRNTKQEILEAALDLFSVYGHDGGCTLFAHKDEVEALLERE